jgi:hypothetical protein
MIRTDSRRLLWMAGIALIATAAPPLHADDAAVIDKALAEVRGVKEDMFRQQSSVLGELPGPEKLAELQLRSRPIRKPADAKGLKLTLDAATRRQLEKDLRYYSFPPGRAGRAFMQYMPLGVTGAMVREFVGRQDFLVLGTEPNAPAAGKLEANDVIIGANGRRFTDEEDPRPEMGYALVNAQSPALGGKLTLHVVRDGKVVDVTMDLGDTAPFAGTWPYDCAKTREIRAEALELVKKAVTPGNLLNLHGAGGFWTPLFLMASGDAEALDMVRRDMHVHSEETYPTDPGGMNSWVAGYTLINACEYYLLTGDSIVLPRIQHLVRILEKQQFPSGSWSHGRVGGYGEINNCGLAVFIGLILARECGAEVSSRRLATSIRFFGQFCGTNFPYGLGSPGGRSGRMDNGMHGMAAVAFHLLGEGNMARRWARPLCYMWMARERGHAEGIFSPSWGMVAADLAPKSEFHMFLNHMLWYYELGRAPDGGHVFLRGSRFKYPGGMCPAMDLFLYLPERRLRILGAPKSVFGSPPPSPRLAKAVGLFKWKRWDALKEALATLRKAPGAGEAEFADRLAEAVQAMEQNVEATLALARRSVAAGKLADAAQQLDGLKRLLGRERPAAATLRKQLGDAPPAKGRGRGRRGKKADEGLVYLQKRWAGAVKYGPGKGALWAPVLEFGAGKRAADGRARRTFKLEPGRTDYTHLRVVLGGGEAAVWLNGYKLADISRAWQAAGKAGGGQAFDLRKGAGGALRLRGQNVMEVAGRAGKFGLMVAETSGVPLRP